MQLTGSDPLISEKYHVEMEFWFARYGPDLRVLKHFGIGESKENQIEFRLRSLH